MRRRGGGGVVCIAFAMLAGTVRVTVLILPATLAVGECVLADGLAFDHRRTRRHGAPLSGHVLVVEAQPYLTPLFFASECSRALARAYLISNKILASSLRSAGPAARWSEALGQVARWSDAKLCSTSDQTSLAPPALGGRKLLAHSDWWSEVSDFIKLPPTTQVWAKSFRPPNNLAQT